MLAPADPRGGVAGARTWGAAHKIGLIVKVYQSIGGGFAHARNTVAPAAPAEW
jgi:hypothetical protein